MNLQEKIQDDLKKTLKARDETKVSTLRLLLAAVKNLEIAKGGAGYKANEEDIVSVIQKEAKQRKESMEAYKAGNRQDLVDRETKELEILENYLPEQTTEDEIRSFVSQAIAKVGATSGADIGRVMGELSPQLKGRADLSLVSKIVREHLY